MSIASEITRLQGAKADIKTAIEAKGVTVPSSAKLDTYDTYVSQISGGGGTNYRPLVDGSITTISSSELGNATTLKPYIFQGCSSMTGTINFTNIDDIGFCAFDGCSSFPFGNLTISSTKVGHTGGNYSPSDNNTNGVFAGCLGLTSVYFTDNVSNFNSTGMFRECSNLTSVRLSENTIINALMSRTFQGCSSLTSITIPSNIRTIRPYNFYYSGLTSITIPNTVTTLDSNNFNHCSNLVTATLGTGVTTIQTQLFQDCTSLTTVTINGNITRLYGNCFKNCSALTTLSSLPTTITNIDADVFSGCTLLTALDYQGTMSQWNSITKNSNWKRNSALTTIHCSDGDITL